VAASGVYVRQFFIIVPRDSLQYLNLVNGTNGLTFLEVAANVALANLVAYRYPNCGVYMLPEWHDADRWGVVVPPIGPKTVLEVRLVVQTVHSPEPFNDENPVYWGTSLTEIEQNQVFESVPLDACLISSGSTEQITGSYIAYNGTRQVVVHVVAGAVAMLVITANWAVTCNKPYPTQYFDFASSPLAWQQYGPTDCIYLAHVIHVQTVIKTEFYLTAVVVRRFGYTNAEGAGPNAVYYPKVYDISLGPIYISHDSSPHLTIVDKLGGPQNVVRKYPFGWSPVAPTPGHSATKGTFIALNATSVWPEIRQLGVMTDGTPRANAPKLNAMSLVQIETRVTITSGELSSGFNELSDPNKLTPLERPKPDDS
jgi:hypothetical protein